jgi:hypothetical protein
MGEKGAEIPALTPDEVIALRQRLAASADPAGGQTDQFAAGVGETVPGGWWAQTPSDTDLLQSGAPVDRGSTASGQGGDLSLFKALSVGRPWVLGVQDQAVGERGAEGAQTDDPPLHSGETIAPLDPFQRSGS